RRSAYLWFAVQGCAAAVLPLFYLGVTQRVAGRFDASLLAIALVGAALASVYFTRAFFGLPRVPRVWPVFALVTASTAVVFHGPFVALRWAGPATILFIVCVMAHQTRVCARLAARGAHRSGALVLLLGWAGLSVASLPDFLSWLGIDDPLGGPHTAQLGLAVFGLCQSLLLSRNHVTSLHRADGLNAELTQAVRDLKEHGAKIEQLNAELRRQLADRSEHFVNALTAAARSTDGPLVQLAPGECVEGRYRVVARIGSGGMGTVHEVERMTDGRRFALKIARERDSISLARLAREAQMACRVSHENVVEIVDVDVASAGYLYIVMQLVEGRSLAQLRSRFGDRDWALGILRQVARGLAALHDAGIVHRDLKPANVLVTPAPEGDRAKITDFGISRPRSPSSARTLPRPDEDYPTVTLTKPDAVEPDGASPTLTRAGFVPGTPAYMAPELIAGTQFIAPPVDMFAFGVMAFEMLAGRSPFAEPPSSAVL
ncbi:MAG TPA: protein kinase, partial [Polyangiaceae bacterium]